MSGLTTHVLDTMHGCPARGMAVRLLRDGQTLFEGVADQDGRCPGMLGGERAAAGTYRLEFGVAAYFHAKGVTLPEPPFLAMVAIDFGVAEGGGHYHVPLLVSPFSYSTYRGS